MTLSKLTVTIPEDLRRRARSIAALRNEHISDVVRAALEQYVADVLEEAEDIRAVQEIEERIASGKVRIKDWSDVEHDSDVVGPQLASSALH